MSKEEHIKKIAEYDLKFAAQLERARNLLDLTTEPGKKLDNFLTPIYKKYGYYNNAIKSTYKTIIILS